MVGHIFLQVYNILRFIAEKKKLYTATLDQWLIYQIHFYKMAAGWKQRRAINLLIVTQYYWGSLILLLGRAYNG